MSDLKQSAPDERESFKAVRELLEYIDDMLTNAQPKIVSSCYPGRAGFIDNYIDPVLERVRSTLSAWQRAQSAPAVNGPAERCDACQGLTLGLTGEQKCCCYCGNRLTGDYVEAAQSAGVPEGWRETVSMAIDLIQDLRQGTAVERRLRAMLAAAPQPAAQGEAVYQIQYLGDGGGGWCDVEKSEHDSYSAQQDYRTRTLYAHATAGGE